MEFVHKQQVVENIESQIFSKGVIDELNSIETFPTKGSVIRESLQEIGLKKMAELHEKLELLMEVGSAITDSPNCSLDDYCFPGDNKEFVLEQLPILEFYYGYDSFKDTSVRDFNVDINQQNNDKSQNEMKEGYNSLVKDCAEIASTVFYLNTAYESFEDGKNYDLTIKQKAAVGL